ncbi:uncharacterized protein Z518_01635 [Rhinocladiella mackenziei CBS 650.93]|uniref:Uncharacterized protein n=1 Tax=Rhinocladiella mackenziei CBS 650.93 TaxID=1442369 RepID=A0A0D2G6H4_9EURO|nr:uncharacterized protein Z518_01635 [Rhinocladiella mackenziei CBS 650.93]KIX10552.1 hypothetical protein Z518_01635 [Rhinocladiella mackenziei CBS 650.93]
MEYEVGDYSDEVFKRIPYAVDVFQWVRDNPMPDAVVEQLRVVFIKHRVYDHFGLSIIHRHYDLEPGERVVELENVATPWRVPDADKMSIFGGHIVPKNWAYLDGLLHPFEFQYRPEATNPHPEVPCLTTAFVAELHHVLALHDLLGVYGLALLPENAQDETAPGRLEFTAGRANITIPFPDKLKDKTLQSTMYLFPCIDPLLEPSYKGPRMRHCWTCVGCA